MTNEAASALIEVAWGYLKAERPVPPHLLADLHEVAMHDSIAIPLRNQARHLLRLGDTLETA